jgi:hypothetical protein
VRIFSYVYPGWHPLPERDVSFYPGFTEWDLVESSTPRFAGHHQPRLPLWGRYDDRDPEAVGRRVELCQNHGIDGWVYGFFWCRGKRVFQDALDAGFLGSPQGKQFPFALMWANRMPRRVLPVRRADVPVLDESRRVHSDIDDFAEFVTMLGRRYFCLDNYIRVGGGAYLSIFDTTFFVRELGLAGAEQAILRARQALAAAGLPEVHLAAIDPQPEIIEHLPRLGFNSVTHYVLLPDWKGEFLQHYAERVALRAAEWDGIQQRAALPYHPAVAPGWDASPRGADFGDERPRKYPWWPVVIGEHPKEFERAVAKACATTRRSSANEADQLVLIASLNEWSEGHYLEPDTRHGFGWLEAVRDGRR